MVLRRILAHPCPLPQGEEEFAEAIFQITVWLYKSGQLVSLSHPMGEGRGEGPCEMQLDRSDLG